MFQKVFEGPSLTASVETSTVALSNSHRCIQTVKTDAFLRLLFAADGCPTAELAHAG